MIQLTLGKICRIENSNSGYFNIPIYFSAIINLNLFSLIKDLLSSLNFCTHLNFLIIELNTFPRIQLFQNENSDDKHSGTSNFKFRS